jgi:methanogenic corrinoid protein MtbC1
MAPDIIALSSLMTTTMLGQKEVIEVLREMGLKDNIGSSLGEGR